MPTGLVKSTSQAPGAPRVGRLLGDLQHQGNRSEGLGQPARSRRLLAEAAEADRQRLIGVPSGLTSHPQLDDHEVGTVKGPVTVVGGDQVSGPAPAPEHPSGQASDDLQPREVRVEQDQLVHHQAVLVVAQTVHEFGCVGAATPYDGYLRSHALNVTSPCGRKRG